MRMSSASTRRSGSSERSRSPKGFGLIEAMISAAMLAVAMTGMLSLITSLNNTYDHERMMTQALHIGEAQMEGLLVLYATDPLLTTGAAHPGPSFTVDGSPGGTFFTTSWTLNGSVPIAGCREIVLTVAWLERGVIKTFVLRTVRT